MDSMSKKIASAPPAEPPAVGPAPPQVTPRPADKTPAPTPPGDPIAPVIEAVKNDPLLGAPLAALQRGDRHNLVLPVVYISLRQASLEALKQSYLTARAALTALIHQPDTQING